MCNNFKHWLLYNSITIICEKNDNRNHGNDNNCYRVEDSFVWKAAFGLLNNVAEMSFTVSRKDCTLKSSTQKKEEGMEEI